MQASHELYIRRCFQLAKLSHKHVKSNPQVGAVLVHRNRIIGEGFHKAFGSAHAEVNCLQSVSRSDKDKIANSTLYISLEPCNHWGKTGPCTEVIKQYGIQKVVFAINDPAESMSGKSVAILEAEGIETITGVYVKEATRLISPFIINHKYQRPYIILKLAQSRDFMMGQEGKSLWLTNRYSKIIAHKWRSEVDALLIGVNTLLIDNPSLTTRDYPGENPTPIIIDPNFRCHRDCKIFQSNSRAIIFSRQKQKIDFAENVKIDFEHKPEEQILNYLYTQRDICRLMIEGGKHTMESFISSNLWDEARVLTASDKILGQGIPSPSITGTLHRKVKLSGDVIDIILNDNI